MGFDHLSLLYTVLLFAHYFIYLADGNVNWRDCPCPKGETCGHFCWAGDKGKELSAETVKQINLKSATCLKIHARFESLSCPTGYTFLPYMKRR